MKALVSSLFDYLTTTLAPTTSGGPTVYLEQAPPTATFPFVTFRLTNSFEIERREDYQMTVDVWDNMEQSTDPTYIDTLVRQIDGNGDIFSPTGLHRLQHYSTTTPSFRIYREAKWMVPDPEPSIRRRHIRYRVVTYDTTSS